MASSSLALELECSVCFDTPSAETKVFQCRHGHLFCGGCHYKLTTCPTCRKGLFAVYGEDADDSDDGDCVPYPIRCLLAEKLIRQLPTIHVNDINSVHTKMDQMNIGFMAFQSQMKAFDGKLGSIHKKLLEIKGEHKEKHFLMDEYGYTEVYVHAGLQGYGVFWGLERDDINISIRTCGVGSSVDAAIAAIAQAEEFGIRNLCVIMSNSIDIYPYIKNLREWKKSGWKINGPKLLGGDKWIPQSSRLIKLDKTLMKYQDVAVRFTEVDKTHSTHLQSTQMLYCNY